MTHLTAGTGAAQHPESNAPALRLNALVKSFGPVRVLGGVSLEVRPGTIHALLGGNGSGKSTTIKVLAGVYAADGGELEVGGVPVDLAGYGPEDAERAGLRFVHQDLGLFDDLSIEENFALASGYPVHAAGGIDWKRLRERVASLIAAYGIAGTPDTPIHRLRPADKTLVAIARALQDEESGRLIVVLDEPTASLGRRESTELLERVRLRAAQGQTFVIVSHRMQEVLAVSDDFTVFRDGKVAAHLIDSSPSEGELIAYMAGSQVRALEPTGSISHARSSPLLAFEGIAAGPLTDVSLTVHRGEIVGVAGLAGSGRSTLLSLAFGCFRPERGRMLLDGRDFSPRTVKQAMKAGIALVPEDRSRDAAFADFTVSQNLSVAVLPRLRRRGRLDGALARRFAVDLIGRFRIKVAGPDALFASMSGGNQQKTILARWMQRDPRLLLLDEPTQGVDAMSRAEIYDVIRESARNDNAAVIVSSDLGELHALCDRIVVVSDGRIVREVAAAETSVDELAAAVLSSPKTEERSAA